MKRLTLVITITFLSVLAYAATDYLGRVNVTQASLGDVKVQTEPKITPWPPQTGRLYPDLQLIDQDGRSFRLSSLMGKVILVEPLGMSCPACQAFAGAHDKGAYGGMSVQRGLGSIYKLTPRYAKGLKLPRQDVIIVQLILYDTRLGAPNPEDARKWAQHFGMKRAHNEIVAVSPYDLRSEIAYNLVPGFQLIDKNFILRSDSTGHHPKDNLYTELLPMIPYLLK
jgi:hypothetical protein